MSYRDWQNAPIVFVEVPTCPHCGTARRPKLERTIKGGDGSFSRRCTCETCNEIFVIVFDLPESAVGE